MDGEKGVLLHKSPVLHDNNAVAAKGGLCSNAFCRVHAKGQRGGHHAESDSPESQLNADGLPPRESAATSWSCSEHSGRAKLGIFICYTVAYRCHTAIAANKLQSDLEQLTSITDPANHRTAPLQTESSND